MRMIFLATLFGFSSLAIAQTPAEPTEEVDALYINSSLTLKVENKEKVSLELIQHAESLGGYYQKRKDSFVLLKIPAAKTEDFIKHTESKGLIANRNFSSQSLSQQLANTQARLKAREELLEKYFQILQEAKSEAVITVEREVIRLVTEIEDLKGSERKLLHQARFSNIEIYFQFRDRRAPTNNGSSSFAWINTLNLNGLIDEFEHSSRYYKSKKVKATAPEGFATYKIKNEFRASSYDNVLYRIRKIKPKQSADIVFWGEAVAKRMKEAGYLPYTNSKSIKSEEISQNGRIIKMIAPYGNDDYAYWVAFQLVGNMLFIVEASGEAGKFNASYSDVILKQITAEFGG